MKTEQPLTKKDLAEFTDEVLLPAVEEIIEGKVEKIVGEKVNKAKLELMDYIGEKIADLRFDKHFLIC